MQNKPGQITPEHKIAKRDWLHEFTLIVPAAYTRWQEGNDTETK
jgi:hypothetical protein